MDYRTDIPLDVAIRAHAGTSMAPEERGEQMIREYVETLTGDRARLEALATTPEKRAILDDAWPRYRGNYQRRTLAWLRTRASCLSTMIAGPSNFPVGRQRKANDREHRRVEELQDFRREALHAITKALQPELRPIMSGDEDAADRLRAKIQTAEAVQEKMRAGNAAIRQHAKGGPAAQVAALQALGLPAKLLEKDFCGRIGFPAYELTNNTANIRRMKARLDTITEHQGQPVTRIDGEAAAIEDDPPGNRVRLVFPGKPPAAVRERLKRAGFRWAPHTGAWQAYRNHNSLAVALEVAGAAAELRP